MPRIEISSRTLYGIIVYGVGRHSTRSPSRVIRGPQLQTGRDESLRFFIPVQIMQNQSYYHLTIDDFSKSLYTNYKDNIWISTDLDIDTPIYHYIELEFLLKLLKTSSLYFSNRCSFSDLKEQGKKENLKHIFSCFQVANTDSITASKQVSIFNQRKESAESFIAISCWTQDVHCNKSDESYILWNWFGKKRLRIQTTIKTLIDNLKVDTHCMVINNVEYKKETFDSTLDTQIFRKDIRYADEQEIRFCLLNSSEGIPLPIIDIKHFIVRLRVSPFIPMLKQKLICNLLTSDNSWLQEKLEYSTILEK